MGTFYLKLLSWKVPHPHPETWNEEFEVEGEEFKVNVNNSGIEGGKVGHDQVVDSGVKFNGTISASEIFLD